jgi:4-amino-4-deoxy-L-arabinose transferase-like glycosyltransferase
MSWSRGRYGALIAATTAVRVVLAAVVPVSGDEAEYWDMSRHPSLAYLDHPPLLFWMMVPFRALLGETSVAIRLPSILSSAAMGVLLVPLVRRLGGGVAHAAYAWLILLSTPLFFAGSIYAWTDALLITFYLTATLGAVMLARGETYGWWVLAAGLGLGFLSKFPVVLAGAALIPLLGRFERRIWRASVAPLAVAAAVTTPVWIWGWQHDWANIRFQLLDRHGRGSWEPSALFDFFAAHVLLFTPFISAAIAVTIWRAFQHRDPAWRAAAVATITPLLIFGASAVRARAGAHWAAPGLVVGCVLVALTPFRWRSVLVRAGAVTCALLLGAAMTILLLADRLVERDWRYPFSPVSISTKALTFAVGNEEIAREALNRLRPGEMAASENYTNVHLWAFLTEGELPTRLAWIKKGGRSGLPSLYWYSPAELRGRNFVFLTEKSGFDDELRRIFADVTEEEPIRVVRRGGVVRTVRVLRCRNLLLPEGTFTLLKS